MIKRLIALITTAVLLATTLTVPSFAASSSSSISFEGIKSIETTVGTGQHLQGTIKCSGGSKLSSVKAEVLSGSNDVVKSAKVNVNTNSYKLYDSDLDWSVPFGQLKAGTYTLKLIAKTNDGGSASKKVSVTVKSKSGSKQDSSSSSTTKKYDPVKALNFACKHAETDFHWLCAEYISRALKAGGLNIDVITGCTSLNSKLRSLKNVSVYELKVNKNGSVHANENKNIPIAKGDVIMMYNNNAKDGLPYEHVVMVSDITSEGLKVYAHNKSYNNRLYYGFNEYSGSVYLYHFS